ncbi:MAG: indolepyruvate ferredoxin oxidoreductase family protein [Burkholderiales bacterium]|nr:indolepyruvate ferredoxin oxidoreductase family protein [Burkholderiales bacterium]
MAATLPLRDISLDDKYDSKGKAALISGPQALVRLLLTQHRRDAAAGLNTAGFVSGYRGSPVGYVDRAMWDAAQWLKDENIIFQPGVNEDLAATAVWGTQQLTLMKNATVDGVFAMWYGKGPGVDRSGDAFKHGNYSGTHPNGGVLAIMGDDHAGKSSTLAHHSEQAMASYQMPVIYPAGTGEFVRLGLLGWAMSRYAGCWCGFKVVNESIEQTATIPDDEALEIVRPEKGELPPEGLHYRGALTPLLDEIIHKRYRLPLAQRFWRANRVDRPEFGVIGHRLGLVTAGKAYGDVMQALRYLGIDVRRAAELRLDVYKVAMIWPLEPEGLREFAGGCEELLFVEEKSAFMEPQAATLFYNDADRPRIIGKFDEQGQPLLPSDTQIEALALAEIIAARLERLGLLDAAVTENLKAVHALRRGLGPVLADVTKRPPFFCSGCPHNTSTVVPDGSVAVAGIGCHAMAMWVKPGTTLMWTHMGAEGVAWAGLHHFTQVPHIFQNLGDGTYYHSGLLAVRQAVAARCNITYKVLFNDAVAMTGGQPMDGPLSPMMIVNQLMAEGVVRVALVSDDPTKFKGVALPPGVNLFHRDELDTVQRDLRATPGCTAIVYEQTCAAEKRRRRKRGEMPDPLKRVVINDAVCEGCGDCSIQSRCVSIEPLETALGRKRQINQSTCNKDYSCLKGFCPSFVTVEGAALRKPGGADIDQRLFDDLPEPGLLPIPSMGMGVMLGGIGGTGVLTVSAVLAMAALHEGLQSSVYDMTGVSQKNGGVLSHLRIARAGTSIPSSIIGIGEAQLVLAFDMLAAMADESFRSMTAGTKVLGNERIQPTASFNFNPDEKIDGSLIARRIESRVGRGNMSVVDATGIATALCGDSIAANFFMVGVALQRGWLPLRVQSIVRAIELNGVQVAFNLHALRLGRLWAANPAALETLLAAAHMQPEHAVTVKLDELIEDRTARLGAYQNERYAQRYRSAIEQIRQAEIKAAPGDDRLTRAAAQALYRLMAYKDEYEVARLHCDPAFHAKLAQMFGEDAKLRFHLAPPLLARRDPQTGHLIKRQFGSWVLPMFHILARLKFLRGTALDVFGYTQERRDERARITHYEALLKRIAGDLSPGNHGQAIELAQAALAVRGYGHVKEAAATKAAAEEQRLSVMFDAAGASRAALAPFKETVLARHAGQG